MVLTDAAWAEIASGSLSPVDAYLTGRLEVAGDLGLRKAPVHQADEARRRRRATDLKGGASHHAHRARQGRQLYLDPNFCCVTIRTAPTKQTIMLLWSYLTQPDNASNRLLHGGYVSLVREAAVGGQQVTLSHSTGSALVNSVTLTS